jgi:uncharacterized membrane protein YciS (DUF1049 family)
MIKWIKRIFIIILMAVALILGVTFTFENSQPIALVFFGFTLPPLKLGLWIMLVLLIGGFIGLLLSYLPLLWGRQSRASKDRKIRQLEKELNHLRSASLKG